MLSAPCSALGNAPTQATVKWTAEIKWRMEGRIEVEAEDVEAGAEDARCG